jgi:lipopolysaccharide export LptBFGC system permease protein LptF
MAALLSATLFAFDEFYLPAANRRQEELRAQIKGRPPQTFYRPDQKWMAGQTASSGGPSRIFYYQAFAQAQNVFANLTVFEFQPETFALQRRIFAQSAHWDDKAANWVLENGWVRTFQQSPSGEIVGPLQLFKSSAFPEIHEQPGYFKIEGKSAQEMSYGELSHYITDLRQSGIIDTVPLRVQLNKKLAYPLITLVMAVLAVPFALSMGRRGGLTGIASAIALAIAYWTVALLFENFGNINSLPPLLAAWSPDILFGLAGGYLLLRTPT